MPFTKGHSGNPGGRKSAEKAELLAALKKAAVDKDKSFLEHFVERAYVSDVVAVALAKKILPDMTESDFGDDTLKTFADLVRRAAGAK
jgi:hypothetical protein